MQDFHHVAEGANPGKDQLFSGKDIIFRFNKMDLFTETFDGVDDASDVSCAVIQQRDHGLFLCPICGI